MIVFIYTTNIQNVDPEEYGGIVEIIKEGFMTAFATFLVRICYSCNSFRLIVSFALGFMDRALFGLLRPKVKYTVDIIIDCFLSFKLSLVRA